MGLSPIDGVTDAVMRYMVSKYGNPDIVFSEFVSVDALAHAKEAKSVERVMQAFIKASEVGPLDRRPYEIAQVFGHTPELFYQAAVMIATLGFDGMDINMGCPAHKVEEQGSGAGLIRIPEVAKEIVRQAKAGMQDYYEGKITMENLSVSPMIKEWVAVHAPKVPRTLTEPLSISLKTRLGVDSIVVEDWMAHVMSVAPAMISLHGRTLKQLYQGEADWGAIGEAATVVHSFGGHILGNGDVRSLADGLTKAATHNLDGFLIGRSAEGNPGIFSTTEATESQRLAWIVEHAKLYDQVFRPTQQDLEDKRNWFVPVRKHLAWYAHDFPGAVELRTKLVMSNSLDEVERIVAEVV